MTIIHSLELHHRAKHRQAKKSLWLSCLRIWFWWRLSGYHITHNRGENKIPLLETLTTGSFHPWLYWQGLQQISVTHQAREKMMPIPTLWSRYPEGEEGHTAGDTHGQERRAGRWFGLKFSYPGVTTHGSTPAASGTPLLTGRHQRHLQSELTLHSGLLAPLTDRECTPAPHTFLQYAALVSIEFLLTEWKTTKIYYFFILKIYEWHLSLFPHKLCCF